MKTVVLDVTGCRSLSDLHARIRTAFDFPAWYGNNWDAFWDLLWSDCDADRVLIRGESTLPAEWADHLATLHGILDDKAAFHRRCSFPPFSYEVTE